jgi:hypothetical protein
MSQRHVETFLGRLATDRELRAAFTASPSSAIEKFNAEGHEFSPLESTTLEELDQSALAAFAETLDARLRRLGQTGSYPAIRRLS